MDNRDFEVVGGAEIMNMVNKPKVVIIELNSYQCHNLLKGLEDLICIANRDNSHTIELYEKIASQLSGRRVKVNLVEEEQQT